MGLAHSDAEIQSRPGLPQHLLGVREEMGREADMGDLSPTLLPCQGTIAKGTSTSPPAATESQHRLQLCLLGEKKDNLSSNRLGRLLLGQAVAGGEVGGAFYEGECVLHRAYKRQAHSNRMGRRK